MKKILLALGLVSTIYAQTFTKLMDSIGWHNVGVPLDNIEVNASTFSSNIEVVWKWNGLTQSWEFYSPNEIFKNLAQSINVPIIATLNKGDALWVKNKNTTSLTFDDKKEFVADGSCTEEVQGIDTRVLKIGSVGQALSDESEEWYGIWYKDPALNLMVALNHTPAGFTATKSQSSAIDYCANLNFLAFDDWDLPSKEEVQMIQYYHDANSASLYKYDNIESTFLWTKTSEKIGSYNHHYYFNINNTISSNSEYSFDVPTGSHQFLCVRTAD